MARASWGVTWEQGRVTLRQGGRSRVVEDVVPGRFAPVVCMSDRAPAVMAWSVQREEQWYVLRVSLDASLPVMTPMRAEPVSRMLSLDGSGCEVAQLDAAGVLHVVSEAGVVERELMPPVEDPMEHPRGLPVSFFHGSFYVGDARSALHVWDRARDERRTEALESDVVGGFVWEATRDEVWWLTRAGALQSRPASGGVKTHARVGVPTTSGAVPWSGRRDRGLAWVDRAGVVHVWSHEGHLRTEALGAPLEAPLLVADFEGQGDLELGFVTRRGDLVVVREGRGELSTRASRLSSVPRGMLRLTQPDVNKAPALWAGGVGIGMTSYTAKGVPARHMHVAGACLGDGSCWRGGRPQEMRWTLGRAVVEPEPEVEAPVAPMSSDEGAPEEEVVVVQEPIAACSSAPGRRPRPNALWMLFAMWVMRGWRGRSRRPRRSLG